MLPRKLSLVSLKYMYDPKHANSIKILLSIFRMFIIALYFKLIVRYVQELVFITCCCWKVSGVSGYQFHTSFKDFLCERRVYVKRSSFANSV